MAPTANPMVPSVARPRAQLDLVLVMNFSVLFGWPTAPGCTTEW
jgi:hypothetical protein